MNVQELIDILNKVENKELQVRLVSDHAQCPMKCNGSGLGYIDGDSYLPDEIHVDDLDQYEGAKEVFILEAM